MLTEMISAKVWEISRVDLEIRRAHISCELGVGQDPHNELQNIRRETNTPKKLMGFKFLKKSP